MATTTTPTVPIDLLGAVNALLSAVGKSHIASLATADKNEAAQDALGHIGRASIETQQKGWEFNTDRCLTLDPALDGTITLPSNCLFIKTVGSSRTTHVVKRGGLLYDPKKQTFAIAKSLTVDMVVALEFSDLPASARWYITCLAGTRYAPATLASSSSYQFSKVVHDKALADFEQDDAASNDSTLAEVNPHVAFMTRR